MNTDATTTDAPAALPPALAQLEAIAAGVDAELDAGQPGAAPAADAPAAEPERDQGAELAAMLGMGVAMLSPALPFLPQCYTPEVCQQIGTAFDAVARKRGWDLSNVMTPELALAVVALPPTIQATVLARVHFAQLKAARAAAERQERQAPPASSHAGQQLAPAGPIAVPVPA